MPCFFILCILREGDVFVTMQANMNKSRSFRAKREKMNE